MLLIIVVVSIRTATGGHNISPNKLINSVESSGITLLAKWLRTFPDDFRLQPVMKVFVIHTIQDVMVVT